MCFGLSVPALSADNRPGKSSPVDLSFLPPDPLTIPAFDHFYNLEYDRAVDDFTQVLKRHPNDAFAVNHLLTAILFHELYRMGVLNTGEYANDTFIKVQHRPPDAHAKQEISDLINKALNIEQNRLAANPNDIQALYTRGITRAEQAAYTGLIEHAWFSALRNAVAARRDHERVLELAPGQAEAKLIVGAHNYVIGSLPWALRSAGAIAGLGGNKDKGIQLLRECAAGSGETGVDAKILLALFLRREHRDQEALPLVRELISAYPRNVLMAIEEGNLLREDGHTQEAIAIYKKVWVSGKDGKYGASHYEIAALSMGDLLAAQKDYDGAAAAYDEVSRVPQVEPEVAQKANLEAGEMYDVLHKRELATQKYQAVIAAKENSACADIARRYLRYPYQRAD